jgi:hypothetical protein
MSIIILGLPNISARGSAFITALGPEPVAGEASKLKNDEPSDYARVLSVNPSKSAWRLDTYSDLFDLGGVALVKHNLSNNAYIRVTESVITTLFLQPNGVTAGQFVNATPVSHTNVVGAIESPDAARVGPVNAALTWQGHFLFSTASVAVRQGIAMASILLDVYCTVTPNPRYYPTIKVDLWDNSGFIRSLGYKAITLPFQTGIAGYQTLVFPFNPAECLADPTTLSFVEARITGYPGDTDIGVFVDTLSISYERNDAPFIPSYDSQWVAIDKYFMSPRDGIVPNQSNHILFGTLSLPVTPTNIRHFDLRVLDDGTELNPPVATAYGANNSALAAGVSTFPDGYIQAGMLISGPKIEIDPGITSDSQQPKTGTETVSLQGTTLIGVSYGADAYTKRTTPDEIELICSRDDMMILMSRIGWQKGASGVFYVILEPDVENKYQLFTSFAAVCEGISANPIDLGRTGITRGQDKFLVRIKLAEKL